MKWNRKKFRIVISSIVLLGFLSILELIVNSYVFQQEISYSHIVSRLILLGLVLYPIRRWVGKWTYGVVILYAVNLLIGSVYSLYLSINNLGFVRTFSEYPLNVHSVVEVVIVMLSLAIAYLYIGFYRQHDDFEFVEGSRVQNLSPSGKYKLVTWSQKTKQGWQGVMAGVYTSVDDKLLFDIRRNHGSFPFCFVEGHPNGHDYLVCGEDYQGQTILELDTRKRVDYLPKGEKKGVGFCWADIHASREKDVLAVEGCFWACPYEQWFVDFTEPMKMPLLVLGVFPSIKDNAEVKKEWSSKEGVTISYAGYDEKVTKTVTWRKPEISEVARYWLEQVKNTKPDSLFLPDMQIQAKIAISKLNEIEVQDLKTQGLIPS